ncbi:hypothetical protein E7747_16375 (plasmid) [Duncaniella dubosii]|uniref:DUF3244 domain-containing protein n=1 Tax=Duncaniella dubosii TaxID=2518971 RepID=A0A4P7W6M8_9BACT|nr:DUF421 domain-containing protein [Duncaniella dubosii]QCD43754.1 hypothetical protein E7747_16000 [Duncaniella dubosii]QCD43821.1 hypothetical protein E7747_16375 [Duncaniella dubosii]
MKTIYYIQMLIMTLVMSSFPLSLAANSSSVSYTVTLQQQQKPTKDHNQQLDKDGQRMPARPVVVYISTTEGVYSSYFDIEDVISYSILDSNGQLSFSTYDVSDFINYLVSCNGVIGIQLELVEYNLEGWLQL